MRTLFHKMIASLKKEAVKEPAVDTRPFPNYGMKISIWRMETVPKSDAAGGPQHDICEFHEANVPQYVFNNNPNLEALRIAFENHTQNVGVTTSHDIS